MVVDHFNIASKNLRKRGVRSWLTMLGIFIGIAAVVSLISLGAGLREAITGQFANLDPNKLVVSNAESGFGPPGSTAVKKLTDRDIDLINDLPGVDIAFGRLIRNGKIEFNDIVRYGYVANLPPDENAIDVVYDALNVELQSGRFLTKNDNGKILLGNDFLDDRFGKNLRLGNKLLINGKSFEITGFLDKAGSFTINSVILMNNKDMRDALNISEKEHDLIIVQVQDQDELKAVAESIEEKFREDRKLKSGEEDFSVETPDQSLNTVNTILGIINLVVVGIAAVSLLVGGIGITNTMYTSVLERTKEIGVMKSVGAKNSDILYIFLFESALLGLAGGLIGVFIGLLLAFLVSNAITSFLPGLNFTVSLSLPLILGSTLFSLFIGSISGILPAIQASRLKPVEALRS